MAENIEPSLKQADRDIDFGRKLLLLGGFEYAARHAYSAVHHAATAYVFVKSRKPTKTHAGLHATFSDYARTDAAFSVEHRKLLGRLYQFKQSADYGDTPVVGEVDAKTALDEATAFVDVVRGVLGLPRDPHPS